MAWNTLSANTGRTSGKIMGFRLYFLGNRYRKNIPVITEILNLSAATECFIWFVYIGRKTWTFFSCSAASTTGCILYIKNICAVCLHGSVWCQRGKKKMSRSFRHLLSCLCRSSVCYFCFSLEEKKKKTLRLKCIVDLVEPFCFSFCPCLSQFNCDARQKRHLALNLFFFLLDILSFTRIHEFSTCIGILFLQHDVN